MKEQSPVSRSGRFGGGPAADAAQFTQSVSFDWRLWEQDILGSLAHAAMLQKIGVLTKPRSCFEIENALDAHRPGNLPRAGFQWKPELEDVHMNIEAELTRRAPAGAKLHTGRSRNDQVALDMRMWLRDEIIELSRRGRGPCNGRCSALGEKNSDVIIPGYTHLQRAQPVYFAHHLLAYVEMLERDCGRLADCFHRANVCPLGSGAIAGSTLPLDREMVAKLLGFVDEKGQPAPDAKLDGRRQRPRFRRGILRGGRVAGGAFVAAGGGWILWASAEFDFITIADAYTTGSSLMPQKKNPDIAELTRGKTGPGLSAI